MLCTYTLTYIHIHNVCINILYNYSMYVYSEEVYSPEELLAMIFNTSRQVAQDYAGTYVH